MLPKRELENGERAMRNGEWGMGNGEWGMGNGEWGIEKLEIVVSVITTEKLEWAHHLARCRKYSSAHVGFSSVV